MDPTQTYLETYPWAVKEVGKSNYKDDIRVKVYPIEPRGFLPSPLFFEDPRIIRYVFGALREMLGSVWVGTEYDFNVCADLRDKDPVFDPLSEAEQIMKKPGEFTPARGFAYIQAKKTDSHAVLPSQVACELLLWDPSMVYLLFY